MRIRYGVAATLALVVVLALGSTGTSAAPARRRVRTPVVYWSGVAANAIVVGRAPASSAVLGGMVHGAMYDAVAAVEGGLKPFATGVTAPPGASADAAVARPPGMSSSPGCRGRRRRCRPPTTRSWPRSRTGRRRTRARLSVPLRRPGCSRCARGDHFDDVVLYVQQPAGPGVFEPIAPTPPVDPKLAFVRPFTYASPSDYRPGPPVELTSKRYAEDVAEVQTYGRVDSTFRSALQTETVRFHTEQTYPAVQPHAA